MSSPNGQENPGPDLQFGKGVGLSLTRTRMIASSGESRSIFIDDGHVIRSMVIPSP